jgi:hypothetical protein
MRTEAEVHNTRQCDLRYRKAGLPFVPLFVLYLELCTKCQWVLSLLQQACAMPISLAHLQKVVLEVCQLSLCCHFCAAEVNLETGFQQRLHLC